MSFKVSDYVDSKIIENASELLPSSKRDQLLEKCVNQAKILIGDYKEIRFKIVELALKCCVIHKGGRSYDERYSVSKFAKEIGVEKSTIFEWMRLRQMALALTEKDRKDVTFHQLSQISKDMRGIRVGDKDFKEKIRGKYKAQKAKHPQTIKMERYLKHLKTIKFNVDNPRMIKDCDPEVLTEIIHVARNIVFNLSKLDKKPVYANVG